MNIGLLIYGSLDEVSGGYLYNRQLMQFLHGRGHNITLFTLPWRSYFPHLTDNFRTDLRHSLQTANLDVLIQDEMNHPSVVWLNPFLRRHISYPIVTLIHLLRLDERRPRWQNALYSRLERAYLRGVDGYIFNSKTTQTSVFKLIPTAVSRPHVLAYPAADRFAELATPTLRQQMRHAPLRVLFVGNLIPRKGLHILLKALETLPVGSWRLDVVGNEAANAPYSQAMRQFVAARPWAHLVRFWGVLDGRELAERYSAAQVFVMPSQYESFGIVYLEAMGFGVPAIGSTAGAAREIITHGRDGYLVAPDDRHAIATHLRHLHTHRPELAHLSQAARTRYESHPTWAETCAKIECFLQELPKRP